MGHNSGMGIRTREWEGMGIAKISEPSYSNVRFILLSVSLLKHVTGYSKFLV